MEIVQTSMFQLLYYLALVYDAIHNTLNAKNVIKSNAYNESCLYTNLRTRTFMTDAVICVIYLFTINVMYL